MRALVAVVAAICFGMLPARAPAAERLPKNVVQCDVLQLVASVAQRTQKHFVLDPRVKGPITLVGRTVDQVTYPELLTILRTNMYSVVDSGEIVQVVPDALVRSLPMAVLTTPEGRLDDEFITVVWPVRSASAPQLVPILRPLMPQHAHLAAFPCRNAILIVDSAANVQRIVRTIEALDSGEAFTPPPCR